MGNGVRTDVRELDAGRCGQAGCTKPGLRAGMGNAQCQGLTMGVDRHSDKNSAFWRQREGRPAPHVFVSRLDDDEGLRT